MQNKIPPIHPIAFLNISNAQTNNIRTFAQKQQK
jgi:hypothetical protein